MSVVLLSSQLENLEIAAAKAGRVEACALLVGLSGADHITVTDIHFSANVTGEDPERSFEIDPSLHLGLQRAARADKHKIVGVWHSHPGGYARPSEQDRARSIEKGWVWLISGRPEGGIGSSTWETKAYRAGENPHSLIRTDLLIAKTFDDAAD